MNIVLKIIPVTLLIQPTQSNFIVEKGTTCPRVKQAWRKLIPTLKYCPTNNLHPMKSADFLLILKIQLKKEIKPSNSLVKVIVIISQFNWSLLILFFSRSASAGIMKKRVTHLHKRRVLLRITHLVRQVTLYCLTKADHYYTLSKVTQL